MLLKACINGARKRSEHPRLRLLHGFDATA